MEQENNIDKSQSIVNQERDSNIGDETSEIKNKKSENSKDTSPKNIVIRYKNNDAHPIYI